MLYRNHPRPRPSRRKRQNLRAKSQLGQGIENLESRRMMAFTVASLAPSGVGSLREAVNLANNNAGPDVIQFDSSLNGGTINLPLNSAIVVTDDVVIDGMGQNITIDGNLQTQLFRVNSPSFFTNIDVTFKGLSFTRGNDVASGSNSQGGAIVSGGANLTLDHTTFTHNVAGHGGAISVHDNRFVDVTLHVTDSTFDQNGANNHGGAIVLAGPDVLIERSSFTDNAARWGGAIDMGGGVNAVDDVRIERSLFANNSATEDGGAVYMPTGGGGYELEVINTTISENIAGDEGGGIYWSGGNFQGPDRMRVINSTIVDNSANDGGGIKTAWQGVATVHNSIVAQNSAATGPDLSGAFDTTSSFNIVGSGAGFSGVTTSNSNQLNTNPNLMVLNFYGGSTKTHKPNTSSPALNAGSDSIANTYSMPADQRGFPRIAGSAVEIGAYEEGPGASLHGQKFVVTNKSGHRVNGVKDSYNTANTESTNLSAGFQTWLTNNSITPTGYDGTSVNQHFADSFQGLPTDMQYATLRIGLKPLGDLSHNDAIELAVRNSSGTIVASWTSYLGSGNSSAGLQPNAWTTANYGSGIDQIITVPASVVSAMGTQGSLDVRVQDDTAVDYVELCYGYQHKVGANNWTIKLIDAGGNVVETQQTMSMDLNNDNVIDPVTETGLYWLENLPAGQYTVTEVQKPFWSVVSPSSGSHTVTLTPGQVATGYDFVNQFNLIAFPNCFMNFVQMASGFEAALPMSEVGDNNIQFDGLSGQIDGEAFAATHGVRFENLAGIGVGAEGDPASIENLDGYDGSYADDGDSVLASWPNHVDPLTISFDEPVRSVGSFVGTGAQGDINTLTISAYDVEDNLLTSFQTTVHVNDDPDNREAFWSVQAEDATIAKVTILNDNPEDYGNALILDDLRWERPRALAGDFDGDGDLDVEDLDALVASIASGLGDTVFDLTGDAWVDLQDRDAWLAIAGEANLGPGHAYLLGDANLDAVVDGSDFLVWNSNKFTLGGLWSHGNFNADAAVDGSDFLLWNAHKFQSALPSPLPAQAPAADPRDAAILELFADQDDNESQEGRFHVDTW